MSFWDLSTGDNAKDTGKKYEIPGGKMVPIPDGSDVLAMIDDAKWDEKDEAEYVSLRWTVLAPDEYQNRKVFQKLWVTDADPSVKDDKKAIAKSDKAKRMLAAIDANAGGKMAKSEGKPTDDSMMLHLANKPMIIKCMLWEIEDRRTGETISGNWVSAVAPKDKGVDVKAPAPAQEKPKAQGRRDMDDEIPF